MLNTLYHPYIVGGAEIVFQEHAEYFQKHGHEVTVVTTKEKGAISWETINDVRVCRMPELNIYWHFEKDKASRFKHKIWHIFDSYNWRMKSALENVVKEIHPDVAICHNLAGFSISVWDVFKNAHIPILQVLHDQYLLCPNSNAFKNGKICQSPCHVCSLMRLPHKKASNSVDVVVGVSNYILNRLLDNGYFNKSKKFVIHNARHFNNIPLPKAWDGMSTLNIGYIGTLSKVKGVEWLIKSFMKLDINAKLVIAGKGESYQYEQYLKKIASTDRRIQFLGYVKLDDYYPKIHVSLVPSLWSDTFPTVAFESCAYHVPVIATTNGGLPEIIQDRYNGILINPNECGSLENAIMEIYHHPLELEKMANNTMLSVRDYMDVDRMFSLYDNILAMLL